MALKIKMLVVLLLASTVLTGCSGLRPVILHPIEKADIFRVETGKQFTSEKDGWFISDFYLEEVMKARIGE